MRTPSTPRRLAATIGAAALLAALGAPAALASDAGCEPLVTHTPAGSQGDTRAVAITSQTLAAGVDGWERVGWQAAEHTTVAAVEVVREDGTEHRTDGDLATGSAEQVLELRFCGSSAAASDGGAAEDRDRADTGHAGEQGDEQDVDTASEADAAADTGTDSSQATAGQAAAPPEPDHSATQAPADAGDDETDSDGQPSATTSGTGADDAAEPATGDDTGGGDAHATGTVEQKDAAPDTTDAAGDAEASAGAATGTHRSEQTTERPATPDDHEAEQATLALPDTDASSLLGGGLLGLLLGAAVLGGAHRRQREARR